MATHYRIMKEANKDNPASDQDHNKTTSFCDNWNYINQKDKELISDIGGQYSDTISNSKTTHHITCSNTDMYRDSKVKLSTGDWFRIREYTKSNLINRLGKGGSGSQAEIVNQWSGILNGYELAGPKLIAWKSCHNMTAIIMREPEGAIDLLKYLERESDLGWVTVYTEDIAGEVAWALETVGEQVAKLNMAGLFLPELSCRDYQIAASENRIFLSNLETIQRRMAASDETILSDPITENISLAAEEIYTLFGEGGLEIFLRNYFSTVAKESNNFKAFYNKVHTLCGYQQAKKYHKQDKLAFENNDYFQKIKISDKFSARVLLQNPSRSAFSPICKMKFSVEQWRKVLELLIFGQKLFSSKVLELKFPEQTITVNIEGGPAKEITSKWQLGHCHINRGIETPWPLALVMYGNHAVIVTEKINDDTCRDYRNIFIVKPSALGDIARAVPVLTALREKYPKSKISWLIRPEFADLVRYNPALDEIVLFDKKQFKGIKRSTVKWIRKYSEMLRGKKFDLVLDMQGLLRSGLIASKTKAPTRIGYKRAREFAWLFYNHKVDTPEINHSNDDCWQVGKAAGIADSLPGFGLGVDRRSYGTAKEILQAAEIDYQEDFLVVLPGGTADVKIWSPEKYGELINIAYEKLGVRSVVIGAGKNETRLAEIICQTAGEKAVVNLINKTSLSEMTAIISYSRLAIGNDSGPLHITAAIPRPVIGIYGPTNPAAVGPVCQLDNVIEAGRDIARVGRYSNKSEHNIENISVHEVFAKLTEILNRK